MNRANGRPDVDDEAAGYATRTLPRGLGGPYARSMTGAVPAALPAGPHLVVKTWRDRWHPDAGGAEVWLDEVVTRLAHRGWRVTVLTAAHAGCPRDEVVDGVRYRRRGGTFSQYLLAHVSQWRLGDPAGVVLDVFNGVPFLTALGRRRATVVVVHHVHREQWRMVFGRVRGAIGWFVEHRVAGRVQRSRRHVTVSNASAEAIADAYGVDPFRISVAHNGFTPAPEGDPAPDLVPADHRLVCLGRLVPHKQVEVAIAALARARGGGRDVHLDVVGAGEWEPDLRAEAARLDMSTHVTFHGWVTEDRKHAILRAADLLVLPSVREGWGLVVVEAAQHGVPTVALASAGGPTESVVDGVTGELAHGPEDLAARVVDLLDDPTRRAAYADKATEHATRFSWDRCADVVAATLRVSLAEDGR